MARSVRTRVWLVVALALVGATVAAGASSAAGSGAITTVAGSVLRGFGGDGGPATSARLALPEGLAADAKGNVYIFDCGNERVRVLRPDATIATIAGTGQLGPLGDGGPATSAQLRPQCGANDPAGLALDAARDLYIADTGDNRVRMVTPAGVITTVAGTGVQGFSGDGGPATAAQVFYPTGLAVDRQGTLYIADAGNQRVRMVTPDGTITTIAGNGLNGCNACTQGEGGPATAFALTDPVGLAVDAQGNVLIADWINDRVYAVSPAGIITTLAGAPHAPTLAGGFSGDGGPATGAELDGPAAVADDGRVLTLGGPASAPAPAVTAARALPLPSNHTCTSRRAFPTKVGAAALNRKRFRAFVDLRDLVRGRYAVRVTAVTTDGRVLVATRRYRTCSRRLSGTIPRL